MFDVPPSPHELRAAIDWLRSADAIRERCARLLRLAEEGRLEYFRYDPERLPAAVRAVVQATLEQHPDLEVPRYSRWRHFAAGGVDRQAWIEERLAPVDADERGRRLVELSVASVMMGGDPGPEWSYLEGETGRRFRGVEGIAVASLHLFLDGGLSSAAQDPCRADAVALRGLSAGRLSLALQVSDDNALLGFDTRLQALRRLGELTAERAPSGRAGAAPRLGFLFDHLRKGPLEAERVLAELLELLGPLWSGREALGGVDLGDVWRHPGAGGEGLCADLVPLHSSAQAMVWAVLEAFRRCGAAVDELDALPGHGDPEHGTLLLDLGVLVPRHESALGEAWPADHPLVVEWRALTVAAFDRIAEHVREELAVPEEEWPVARVLQGGAWAAARRVALRQRPDGSPLVRVLGVGWSE